MLGLRLHVNAGCLGRVAILYYQRRIAIAARRLLLCRRADEWCTASLRPPPRRRPRAFAISQDARYARAGCEVLKTINNPLLWRRGGVKGGRDCGVILCGCSTNLGRPAVLVLYASARHAQPQPTGGMRGDTHHGRARADTREYVCSPRDRRPRCRAQVSTSPWTSHPPTRIRRNSHTRTHRQLRPHAMNRAATTYTNRTHTRNVRERQPLARTLHRRQLGHSASPPGRRGYESYHASRPRLAVATNGSRRRALL